MTTPRADKFLLQFAALFLCVLLMMFALFHLMRAYDGHPIRGGVLNFDEMFRVNLFIIDLSLLIVFECLLILVFIRYTVPALVISTLVVTVLSTVGRRLIGRDTMLVVFARLVRNEYARLDLTDTTFLFLLNALLMAFMVAIMYHHQALDPTSVELGGTSLHHPAAGHVDAQILAIFFGKGAKEFVGGFDIGRVHASHRHLSSIL